MTFSKITRSSKVLITSMLMLNTAVLFFIIDVIANVFLIDLALGYISQNTIKTTLTLIIIVGLTSLFFQIKSLIRSYDLQKVALDSASGQLVSVVNNNFEKWKLSESEKEVAWLLIKALSIQEIADARNTKIGTVKSQSNSVYQKAGLQGRAELVSYFVEDLLA
jgi:DNA-binding CsgD family transcriptional regulator